ncbi:MAG: SAM hydrolase/SAM-dependent halogenase family protein [Chloroflexota bacterium]
MNSSPVITLTTDFGTRDPYVPAMKGVILNINPDVTIVDISHDIEPQNTYEAAYILDRARRYFPDGTTHIVVVDPGVGTGRNALAVKVGRAFFIAPDNGVLTYVVEKPFEAVSITNPQFWNHPVSSTFHGRDIFAPVAAHLSLRIPISEFGEPVTSLLTLPRTKPCSEADGSLVGHVIHIDRFGNAITDISRDDIPENPVIHIKNHSIEGLSSSYAEGNELLALIGSDGKLEIAVKNGNAAESLNLRLGDEIIVRRNP